MSIAKRLMLHWAVTPSASCWIGPACPLQNASNQNETYGTHSHAGLDTREGAESCIAMAALHDL
eukprot:scaffold86410_cov20-Prasinocladus_malaysianus.AAC.1